MFKKAYYTLVAIAVLCSVDLVKAQKNNLNNSYNSFTKYYSLGDFINAEKSLLNILESKESLTDEYIIATYNNLGVLNNLMGKYDDAFKYLNFAESEIGVDNQYSQALADIYINKARNYGIIKEPNKAIEYLEQGVKIYLNTKNPDKTVFLRLSSAYLNLGLTYLELKDYNSALLYLEKSKNLKLNSGLPEIALTFLNIAKTYAKINNREESQTYFIKSIAGFNKEFGADYYRLAEAYFDYGLFLRSIGKTHEAFEVHKKALAICLKNYGNKHTIVSLAYKHLGDHYFIQSDYQMALNLYQKSLIAVVSNFNDSSIHSNPLLSSVLFDIRLLENLKQKAKALELFSLQQENSEKRLQIMDKSFETIKLAIQLIGRIRGGYVSIDSRFYLAENEKDTYVFAVHVAQELYECTKNPEYLQQMYSITCNSKSAVLRNEITENQFIKQRSTSDSLNSKRNKLLVNINSYGKLIQDEFQRVKPDTQKINFWKTTLFDLNRKKEKINNRINEQYPQLRSHLQKTEAISLSEIQNNLKTDETLIEYFLSNHYSKGKRELHVFTITNRKLDYQLSSLDSNFSAQVDDIKISTSNYSSDSYKSYTDALFYMYNTLIKPVENHFAGKKIIVVPDEEIAYLPFDAFIRYQPDANQASYDGLHYLIYDYTISYGYTSSLIFQEKKTNFNGFSVYAFSPGYIKTQNDLGENYSPLLGTGREINSIFNWFDGIAFDGEKATESNFKRTADRQAIFHLAMHSQTDSSDSKYSYLIFDNQKDTIEDGKLFNYEISMNTLESPMVVLSACNTGSGNLYHGEGVMSLTRSFFLAGASSVVSTFWDVNDDASAKIMIDFYHNLSLGYDKNEALRMAKLNYLKSTPPTYINPSYWAAYEILGDTSPVKKGIRKYILCFGGLIMLGLITYVVYFKRFRRFKA